NTPLDDIKTLRDWYKGVRHEYGIGFDERVKIGSAILRIESHLVKSIIEEYDRKVEPKLNKTLKLLHDFSALYSTKIKNLSNLHQIIEDGSEISRTLMSLKQLKIEFEPSFISKQISLSDIESALNLFDANMLNLLKFNEIRSNNPILSTEWNFDDLMGEINSKEMNRAKKTLSFLHIILDSSEIIKEKLNKISDANTYHNYINIIVTISVIIMNT